MASFFLEIFNLSMAACWIIGAVFTVRMLFVKSMPKWLVCCLWGLVAIRLLLPVTVESNISLVPNQQLELYIPSEDVDENSVFVEESVPTKEEAVNDSTVKVPITNETVSSPVIDEAVSSPVTDEAVSAPVTDEAVSAPVTDENISVPEQNTVIGDQNNVQDGINENGNIQNTVQTQSPIRKNQISVSFVGIAAIVWAVGFCIMTLYSVLSYILLKRRVRMSFPCGDKVRKGEGIDSPFVLGFLRPRIYIPFGLSQRTEECVIAHERAHLARRDYIIKPLAFLILSVHWFNPFVWVAYILLCRDIEYACDERVVKGLDTDERKAYAFALLECAISHRRIAACPVAFGETGVKERVKNTMKYKKPAFWIIVICVIVCITVAVLFLTTGVSENDNSDTSSDVSDTSSETSDNAENGVYTQVDSFINEGKFEEAYKLLLTVKSEQKAKDMLKDFIVVCETESQYGRGNNGTGLIDEFKTEYDANGNPVKITKLGSNRDIQTVTQMSYDKDNNLLTKDIYYSGAEKPKISIEYTYDENGWLIKEFHTDRSENSPNLEQTFEYVYDSHGNVVEKRTTNFFGFEAVEVVRYVLKYDEKGRLIEKYNEEEPEYVTYYSYYDDGTLKKEWSDGWLKEYDENGNIVKSDTGDEKDDYVYNADGKLLKHTCDDGKSVTVYEYTYDENGYLVKKTADSDEYGVTTWQYYNDAYGNPEKMALTYDSGKDDGYIYHYKGYKYFYRPQKKSEGNSEKNPNDSVQKDYIDDLFAAEFVEYEDLGKYENCVKFVSDKEYNVMSVLITPKTTIYDFRIYSLVDNIDTVALENILFEAKSISADKPLLAEIEFGDILAENGISFTDENGNEYLYKLVDNPYDGKLIVYDVTAESSEESKGEISEPETSEPEQNEPEQNVPVINTSQSNGKVNVVGKTLGAGGASQGDWIYYVEGNQFFKINQNTYKSETIFILPMGWAANLNVVGDWLYFSVPETTDESAYIGKVRTDGRDFQKIVYTNDVWEVLVIGETVYYTSTNNPYTVWAKDVAPLYSVSVNGGAVTQVHDGSVENLVADENYIYFQYREKAGGKRSFVRMNHNATSRQTLWINELAGTEIDSFGFVVSEGRIYFAERYDNSETYRTVSSISINGGDYVAHFRANLFLSSLWAKNGKIYFGGVAPEYRDGYIGEYGDLGLTEYDMASGRFTALYDECQCFYPTNEMLVVPEMHALWLYDYDSKTFRKVLLYV